MSFRIWFRAARRGSIFIGSDIFLFSCFMFLFCKFVFRTILVVCFINKGLAGVASPFAVIDSRIYFRRCLDFLFFVDLAYECCDFLGGVG